MRFLPVHSRRRHSFLSRQVLAQVGHKAPTQHNSEQDSTCNNNHNTNNSSNSSKQQKHHQQQQKQRQYVATASAPRLANRRPETSLTSTLWACLRDAKTTHQETEAHFCGDANKKKKKNSTGHATLQPTLAAATRQYRAPGT